MIRKRPYPTHERKLYRPGTRIEKRGWKCLCETCGVEYPDDQTRKIQYLHELIMCFLCLNDERGRRLFAGLVLAWSGWDVEEAKDDATSAMNKQAMRLTASITGLDPRTIERGLRELRTLSEANLKRLWKQRGGDAFQPLGWAREEGGGRKPRNRPEHGVDD